MSFIAAYDSTPGRRPRADLRIRRATGGDVPALAAIAAEVRGPDPARPDALRAAVCDPDRLVLVAVPDQPDATPGPPVGDGMVAYLDRPGAAPAGHYLAGVTVAPRWRRQGVAAALTRARLDWIWARAERAWYFANAANQASLALHAAFGFVEVARGPEFQSVRFEGGTGVLLRADRPLPGS